jgi:hypothetical protein
MRRIVIIALISVLAGIAFGRVDAAAAPCTVPNQLTNGQMADATQVMANLNALISCINSAVTPVEIPPQGRLTLTSNTPVMTADATGQTTIYYAPYQGNQLPVAGVMYPFSQLSYALSTSAHLSGNLYDIFAYNGSGSVALCSGPAWTSTTVRLAGIAVTNGIWSNAFSLTCTLSGGGSTTTIAAGNATYLGTFYATANGQTGMAFKPTQTSGGTNGFLALYNAYNRVPTFGWDRDSTGSWTYQTIAWRASNNSSSNRVTFVDGLGQSFIFAKFVQTMSGTNQPGIGLNLDSTSAMPDVDATHQSSSFISQTVVDDFMPQLGLHYVQAMEKAYGSAAAVRFYGDMHMAMFIHLAM